jgi:hypothetical protein
MIVSGRAYLYVDCPGYFVREYATEDKACHADQDQRRAPARCEREGDDRVPILGGRQDCHRLHPAIGLTPNRRNRSATTKVSGISRSPSRSKGRASSRLRAAVASRPQ